MQSVFDRVLAKGGGLSEVRQTLAEAMRGIELRHENRQDLRPVWLGFSPRTLALAGEAVRAPASPDVLRRGCIHEWLSVPEPSCGSSPVPDRAGVLLAAAHVARRAIAKSADESSARAEGRPWPATVPPELALRAPLGGLCDCPDIARRLRLAERERCEASEGGRTIVWIGRRCWPSPPVIGDLLECSLWIDPPDVASRHWAIDVALRCAGVAGVIADGSGLDMAGSRRLQLAAEAGGTLGVLMRPSRERAVLSVAATRWLVGPEPTEGKRPRWSIELLRCKGMLMDLAAPRRFTVEWDHAQGALVVPPELAGGTGAPAGQAQPQPVRVAG